LKILPPEGVVIDETKRPYIIIDPRAGHGAGIGGFKNDSQVGVALAAGHPVYFVSFRRDPIPGQTLADANLLRLRLDYGVPLVVPVVGRLISSAVRVWNGCEIGSPKRIGLIRLDTPQVNLGAKSFPCAMFGSGIATAAGLADDTPRLPMSLVATVRMQSPARQGGEGGISESGDGGEPIPDVGLSGSVPSQVPAQTSTAEPTVARLSDLLPNQSSDPISGAPSPQNVSGQPLTPRSLLQTLSNAVSANDPAVCSIPDG
jgi:hypothetical protein